MKNQKGITLISLVITIIVMMILASIITVAGLDSIKISKKTTFITELELIQAKVSSIYEKRKLNQSDLEYYNSLGQDISAVDQEKLTIILKDVSKEGYRFFSKENLTKLDLENITQDVLINYDTREVYSYQGIKIDGVTYYRLEDIPNYMGYNVQYTDLNKKEPTFRVEVTKEIDKWRISLKDIVYNSKVEGGTVSHKLYEKTNWILDGDKTSFTVDSPGLYNIKLTDKAGNSTVVQKFIQYDYVTDGLVAYYDAECNIQDGHSDTTTVWRDLSGNNHDAILKNFNFNDVSGWKDKSIQCEQENSQITFPVELQEAQTFSIDIIFTEGMQYRGENWIIASNNWWKTFGLHTYNNDGSIYIGGNYALGGDNDRFTPNEINYRTTLNQTEFLTYTYNGHMKEAILYINGQEKCRKTYTTNPEASQEFYIVNSQMKYSRISIYNKVLRQEEIEQNYQIDQHRFSIKK